MQARKLSQDFRQSSILVRRINVNEVNVAAASRDIVPIRVMGTIRTKSAKILMREIFAKLLILL
jgi:hypothetical protein